MPDNTSEFTIGLPEKKVREWEELAKNNNLTGGLQGFFSSALLLLEHYLKAISSGKKIIEFDPQNENLRELVLKGSIDKKPILTLIKGGKKIIV